MYPSRHKTDYMVVFNKYENVTLITELENKGYYENTIVDIIHIFRYVNN